MFEKITPLTIIAQIFGALGMICLFWSYQQKERSRLIMGKLGADVMWVIHYLMLSAFGGAIPNFVGIFRELIFLQRDKDKKWAQLPVWPAIFILINWTLAVLIWRSAITLIPICASTFVTLSLWARKPKITRMIGLPVSICFFIYDIFVGSFTGMINESVAIVSIVTSMLRNDRKSPNDTK